MYKSAIILAAGKGTRMKSKLHKVLHKVCGKEIINQVVDTLKSCDIADVNVVIGNLAKEVKGATKGRNISYSFQEKQLGTGHAVICAKDFLKGKKGTVGIFAGDAPLISKETIVRFMNFHEENGNKATILSSILQNPTGYGRIVRNSGNIEKIVEHKDCTEEELKIKEVNSAIYIFDIEALLRVIEKIDNNNAQGEYYLTDAIGVLRSEGEKVDAMIVDHEETLGINSKVQLSEVESIMRDRINKSHMLNGVTIIDPKNTYIDTDVMIKSDVVVYPGVFIEGSSKIEEGCILRGNTRIKNSTIGKNTIVENSVICNSTIGENTSVGPFAYIRPESNIGDNVKIGDFVEIKKATIGNDTKVSHLTYIGDAEVGERCNFGCGTVVVNYDGKNKYKTIVHDDVFIGCNTNLVSPVEVEDNAYIAAGSTITKKVEKNSLAIARSRQTDIKDWVTKHQK